MPTISIDFLPPTPSSEFIFNHLVMVLHVNLSLLGLFQLILLVFIDELLPFYKELNFYKKLHTSKAMDMIYKWCHPLPQMISY